MYKGKNQSTNWEQGDIALLRVHILDTHLKKAKMYSGVTKVYVLFSFISALSTLFFFIFAPPFEVVEIRISFQDKDLLLEW